MYSERNRKISLQVRNRSVIWVQSKSIQTDSTFDCLLYSFVFEDPPFFSAIYLHCIMETNDYYLFPSLLIFAGMGLYMLP